MSTPALSRTARLLTLVLLAAAAASSADAQALDPSDRRATREMLQAELIRYEQLANSPAYGDASREKAMAATALLRRRLSDGDFRPGDRIELKVEGAVPLHDTLVVTRAVTLDATGIAAIELRGALRSELAARVREQVTAVVRTATVTVQPLMSVAVFGAVARPGYFSVSEDAMLDELLTLAGGATGAADPNNMTVRRGVDVVLTPAAVSGAIAERRAVGDLRLAEGDVLEVGERKVGWDRATTLQIVSLVFGPLITFLLVR